MIQTFSNLVESTCSDWLQSVVLLLQKENYFKRLGYKRQNILSMCRKKMKLTIPTPVIIRIIMTMMMMMMTIIAVITIIMVIIMMIIEIMMIKIMTIIMMIVMMMRMLFMMIMRKTIR